MATAISGNWSAILQGGQTVYVSGNRTVSGPVQLVDSSTSLTVSSGAIVSGLTNPASSTSGNYIGIKVLSGGTIESSTMNEIVPWVYSGGIITDTVFNHCGVKISGGTLRNDSSVSGGDVTLWGGTLQNFTVGSSTNLYVNTGYISGLSVSGTSARAYVSSGSLIDGNVFVGSGGAISGGVLASGAQEYVSNGGYTAHDVFGVRNVLSGGSVAGNISAGGTDIISNGGRVTDGSVWSGGTRIALSGGNVSRSWVRSGAQLLASNGAILTDEHIINGYLSATSGALLYGSDTYVNSGGTATGGTLTSGAIMNVSGGGVASGTTIASSGNVLIGSGGTAVGTVVSGYLSLAGSGGMAYGSNVRLLSGGHIDVGYLNSPKLSGLGTLSGVTLSGGYIFAINSAVITDAVVSSGGALLPYSGAVFSNSVISSGGIFDARAGGTMFQATLLSGGSGSVESGGTYLNGNVSAGGKAFINSGGTMMSGSIQSGAYVTVSGAALAMSAVVQGGTIEFQSGGNGSFVRFGSGGGVIKLDSGMVWSSYGDPTYGAQSGGTFIVSSGATGGSLYANNGGTIVYSSGGIITGTQTVSSGGTLIMNGTAGNGAVNLAGDGASLIISGTQMPTNVISGWSNFDRIELASIPKSSISKVERATNTLRITTTDGKIYSLNVPQVSTLGYEIQDDGRGNAVYTTCFAEGTLIATPSGAVAVEGLSKGDMVQTPKGAMPVKWMGYRSINVAEQRIPEENWLVRIRAGALEDGVPSRDLLVTQEHCMVFEGRMVPARMLVNGVSVLLDRTIGQYTYYHVELETHEALWAEGALTESYLDTGNRDQFENGDVTVLFPTRRAMGSMSLPLDTSRVFVEPIYLAIMARAGMQNRLSGEDLTEDADLHLMTDLGGVIRPCRVQGKQHVFMVPADVESVVIASRTSRPSDVIGPFVDDRRDLGVLVGTVNMFGLSRARTVTKHLEADDLAGWAPREAGPLRWTAGAAMLPIGSGDVGEMRILAIEIVAKGPYRVQKTRVVAA